MACNTVYGLFVNNNRRKTVGVPCTMSLDVSALQRIHNLQYTKSNIQSALTLIKLIYPRVDQYINHGLYLLKDAE